MTKEAEVVSTINTEASAHEHHTELVPDPLHHLVDDLMMMITMMMMITISSMTSFLLSGKCTLAYIEPTALVRLPSAR